MKKFLMITALGLMACSNCPKEKTAPTNNRVNSDKVEVPATIKRIEPKIDPKLVPNCEIKVEVPSVKTKRVEGDKHTIKITNEDVIETKQEGKKRAVVGLTAMVYDPTPIEKARISKHEYMVVFRHKGRVAFNLESNKIFLITGLYGYKNRVDIPLSRLFKGIKEIEAEENDLGVLVKLIGKRKFVLIQLYYTKERGYYGTEIREFYFK